MFQFNLKRFTFVLLCLSFGAGLFARCALRSVSQNQKESLGSDKAKILPCFPSGFNKPISEIKVSDGKTIYYEITASSKKSSRNDSFYAFYFKVIDSKCYHLNKEQQIGSRLLYMPEKVAVEMVYLRYNKSFQKCLSKSSKSKCIEIFEKEINQAYQLGPGGAFLYPEDVIALKKLGIKTDKATVIKNQEDFDNLRSRELKKAKPGNLPGKE